MQITCNFGNIFVIFDSKKLKKTHASKKISLIKKMFSCSKKEKLPELLPISDKYCFKWKKLLFEDEEPFIFHDTRLNLEDELIFDLWENSFDIENNVHINNHLQIHYEHNQKCVPFILRIENINGVVERGRDLKRIQYFKPTSLIQAGLIYEIFADFEGKLYDVLKIPDNELLDNGNLIRLNCSQKLPISKVIYFRNLLVCFEKIEKLVHRKKERHCLVARII